MPGSRKLVLAAVELSQTIFAPVFARIRWPRSMRSPHFSFNEAACSLLPFLIFYLNPLVYTAHSSTMSQSTLDKQQNASEKEQNAERFMVGSASLQFGDLTAGNDNRIFQGIQIVPLPSALERKQFRHGNPPPLNRNFLGREDKVAEIRDAFREAEAGKQHRYVIYGMAGIGKSEICVKLFNDMESE